jgi:DNA (cytosine-5)-methyltransferase 1
MGYKLAGFDVIGANDIDPKMRRNYEANLHPSLFIEAPVRDMLAMDLPDELFALDVLDGSPPCSTFSMSGDREKAWGREKFFREGQAAQVLDDLFFDYIDVVERLRPRVAIAENVKGMILGNARGYVSMIFSRLREIGYRPQIFLVNAAYCGVPQRRERVFVCALRDDIDRPPLSIVAGESPLPIEEAFRGVRNREADKHYLDPGSVAYRCWHLTRPGKDFSGAYLQLSGKTGYWDLHKISPKKPGFTVRASGGVYHWAEPRTLTAQEFARIASFPDDYTFLSSAQYLVGMSVPPRMMEVVASAVRDQWLLPKEEGHAAA